MRARNSQAGFSLLETLLGLTLTAMIGLLMMGSMQMGARVWEHDRKTEQPGADQLLLSQVSEWLGQAMVAKVRSMDDNIDVPFRGDAQTVSFQYASPSLGGAPGLYTIELQLAPSETCQGQSDLFMQATRLVSSQSGQANVAPPESRRLLTCLENASFIYWNRLEADLPSAWQSEWVGRTELPALVRLRTIDGKGVERALITQTLMRAPL